IRDFHVTGVQTCALPISATGIVAALLHARLHGAGVHLDVALVDAALGANPLALAAANAGQAAEPAGRGLLNGGAPCYGLYRCAEIGRASCRERGQSWWVA